MKKPWYESKTVWFNIISIAVSLLGTASGMIPDGPWSMTIPLLIALGNGILRIWFTNSGIGTPDAPTNPPNAA